MPKEIKDVYVDKMLTNYSLAWENGDFVGEIIAPSVKVPDWSGRYWKFGMEAFYSENDYRRPGDQANEVRKGITYGTYTVDEHAHKIKVPQQIVLAADQPLQPIQESLDYIINKIKLNREVRIKELVIDAGTFSGITCDAGQRWTNTTSATSKPFDQMVTGSETVRKAIGKRPTHVVFGPEAAIKLQQHPDFIARYKNTDSGLITTLGLPPVILGMKVLVASAFTSASEDATAFTGDLWSDNVVLIYVNPNPGLMSINTITTFSHTAGEVRKWFDMPSKSYYMEYSETLGEQIVTSGGAYVIKDTCV